MRRRLSLTAALVLLLSLLCACAAQHAQEMDENGYELYFLSDPNSAGGGDAIRTQEKRLTLDGAMETEDCVRAQGMTYSQFIGKLNAKGIVLNRKVLADLAMNEPKAFEAIVNAVK